MRSKLILIFLLLFPLKLQGQGSLQFREVTQGWRSWGDTHGGYGYIDQSEAQASQILIFGCGKEEIKEYQACSEDWIPMEYQGIENIKDETAKASLLDKLRFQLFEHLVLQKAAIGRHERPLNITLPSCLRDDQKASDLLNEAHLFPHDYATTHDFFFASPFRQNLLFKYNAVQDHVTSGNVLRALALHDQIDFMRSLCGSKEASFCVGLKNMQLRLRASHPLLFTRSRLEDVDPQSEQIEKERLSPLRQKVQKLLGGESLYNEIVRTTSPGALAQLEGRLKDLVQQAASHSDLSQALQEINQEVEKLQNGRLRVIQSSLEGLCEYPLSVLITREPNTVRQALLDMTEDERSLAKSVICKSPSQKYLLPSPHCDGVSGGPFPGSQNIRIERKLHGDDSWHNNQQNYTISRPSSPADAPYEISMKIYVTTDENVSDQDLQNKLEPWKNRAQNWFNCQSGVLGSYQGENGRIISCPPLASIRNAPRIKFNFQLERIPKRSVKNIWRNIFGYSTPLIFVHKCYNNDLPYPDNQDCQKIRAHHIKQCIAQGGSETDCERTTPPAGHPNNNRQNSNNWTLNTSARTLIHETGHLMGLRDEYQDPNFPFNFRGERDSIMNPSSKDETVQKLYPHHIEEILAPVRCMNPDHTLPH